LNLASPRVDNVVYHDRLDALKVDQDKAFEEADNAKSVDVAGDVDALLTFEEADEEPDVSGVDVAGVDDALLTLEDDTSGFAATSTFWFEGSPDRFHATCRMCSIALSSYWVASSGLLFD
jgi:hypothetical protein